MVQKRFQRMRSAAGLILAICLISGAGAAGALPVLAEEQQGYLDESGLWITAEDSSSAADAAFSGSSLQSDASEGDGSVSLLSETEDSGLTGAYTVADGWTEDTETEVQTEDTDTWVYRQDSHAGETETSTITCSYMDTAYSVFEYEQLREMLVNNLLYNNVDAQISTSAVYTLAKDYLYIVLVDDSAEAYRDIYHYVVGDYRCFCVHVCEYRTEAQQMEADDQATPQEAGRAMAEGFTWNES